MALNPKRESRHFLPAFREEILRTLNKHIGNRHIEERLKRWQNFVEPRPCLTKGEVPDCKCTGCYDRLCYIYFSSVHQQFKDGREYLRLQSSDALTRAAYEADFAEGRRKV